MRVSERHRFDTVGVRVERAKADNARMLDLLSTQKRVNKISDDPIGASQVIRGKSNIRELEQFQRNIDFAKGFLEKSEMAISTITDNLIRAKELAVSLANATYAQDSKDATAREVAELRRSIMAEANATYGNRFVFGGFRTQTPPLNNDGRFTGDDGAIFLQIDGDNARQINLQARSFFEPSLEDLAGGHTGLVDAMDMLNEGLTKGDNDLLRRSIDELDHQLEKATSYQATIGARHQGLESAAKQLTNEEELAVEGLSRVEDADFYRVTSDFRRTETILQSTLLAANKLLQPSLLNFLQ